ncbi:intraflagellar transport protein [Planoprotostelium fungivorum]|uniref:Intraflagellar transport protein n=1 Tax=Planoprotostelium fungivorum TaxID=1890364 RepID=A0A2P6NVW6_9EUKA|nr:intraflagellar transport protein [Planoprotostelium fungivorum]
MQTKHFKTISPGNDSIQKIQAICWSPNNMRMAAVSSNKNVYLYDENGEQREKFPTKAADPKLTKNYAIRGLCFSPDSTKLAIAQSDNVVFVYKLGAKWGEKKSISNKYQQTSSITTLCWPSSHSNELFFGLSEGKGNLRTNKSSIIYSTEEYVVSMCANPKGNAMLAGHINGDIYMFSISATGTVSKNRIATHTTIPYVLSWGESIVAAGNDYRIIFYDIKGDVIQRFDYSHDEKEKGYTCGEFSPSGQSVILGSFNRFRTFSYSTRRQVWEDSGAVDIQNMYTLTSLSWKRDGSKLVVGTLTGGLEMYDACLRRFKYKGKFEMVYVSPSQVIVKRLSNGEKIMLNSLHGHEITKVNVYQDRYLIAHTQWSIIMGDLNHKKKLISEIQWQLTGNEKFHFDNPGVCMISNAGELTLVEYGSSDILGICRTEHVSPHLISVRVNEKKKIEPLTEEEQANPPSPPPADKKIAYLIDTQTVHILDLRTNSVEATINHDCKIDWLELNYRANKLLFRDNRRALNLFDIPTQTRVTLLNLVSYVQWVPKADVVVAQSRSDLCVWYSIDNPERVKMMPIKGDVIDIEKTKGKTEVVVDEGVTYTYVSLNEALISFGSAVEAKKFVKAAEILDGLPKQEAGSPESEAMWKRLSALTIESRDLKIAERCFAALGEVSKSRYLRKLNKIVEYAEKELNVIPGTDYYVVKARLAILEKSFSSAEQIYMAQGLYEECMEMYQEIHKWEESIRVAEAAHHPEVEGLRNSYFNWLLDTKQEERAAVLKERSGEYFDAISLYLKGGLPAKAALLVSSQNLYKQTELTQRIADSLFIANLFEKAGHFFEKLGQEDRALESYRKGHAYRAAVELARNSFPSKVVGLEEEWADYLMSINQYDQAMNHYLDAGQYVRAFESAVASKQWGKAVNIVESLDAAVAKKYYKQIAHHYEEALNFELAEKYYVKGEMAEEAVEMYTKNNMWDAAHTLAVTYMTEREVNVLYLGQAQKLESQGKFKEAEKLYLTVEESDQAINMYKKAKLYDDMIRLVTTFHKSLLAETHKHLAQQLEAEGQYKQAEKHFIDAGDWKSATNMYRANDMWEDAMRVAKQLGGSIAATQVASAWANSVGGEAGINLLLKFGFIEPAVDFSVEIGMFKKAEEICKSSLKKKLVEVYLKHALALEDEGRLSEAEAEFIKAGSAKDAIDMYIHNQDWVNAQRVAESFDPNSMLEILEAQGKVAAAEKDFAKAEQLYISARKPEMAYKMYREAGAHVEAERVMKEHIAIGGNPIDELYGKEMDAINKKIASGDYSGAIDLLLAKGPNDVDSQREMEEAWENAVKLASSNVPDRVVEVVQTVASRFQQIGKFQQSALLLEGVDMLREAIDVYISGDLWSQAQALAESKAQELVLYVIEHKLNILTQRNEWDKALELAQSQGEAVLGRFSALFAAKHISEGDYVAAVGVFVQWGIAPLAENFPLYAGLINGILALPANIDGHDPTVHLRKVIYSLIKQLKEFEPEGSQNLAEFERLFFIIHLAAMKEALTSIHEHLCVALLRYCGDVPTDKTFYEAGMACRDTGRNNMAYNYLNRFVDISEELEEEEPTVLENTGFENTDIPFDLPLPTSHYLDEEKREDAKNWVLQASLTNQEYVLSKRNCDGCSSEIYEASSWCYACSAETEVCIVSGYPVLRSNKIQCTSCTKSANREDWNKYIAKMRQCPWCNTPQSPSY